MPCDDHGFARDLDACGVGLVLRLPARAGAGVAAGREPIARALEALRRMAHRGGCDADGESGDGAGLLTDLPRAFLRRAAAEVGLALPEPFAAGTAFLPPARAEAARFALTAAVRAQGLDFLGWREAPQRPDCLGPLARRTLPRIFQFFVGGNEAGEAGERQLFWARKRIEAEAPEETYVASLSARTMVYKGLLTAAQLAAFYPDLQAEDFVSRFAIFHLRFSTNTRPSWRLAQPFRCLAHNGEINAIGANRRWLAAREAELRRELGGSVGAPLLEWGASDSASFDNAGEIELRRGRAAPEALARLMPPAWENDAAMASGWRAWFRAAAREQEPWDGPAAVAVSDGRWAGAQLDRNGLRPLRYTRTGDGLLIVGSEAGLAELAGAAVAERGRLGPGEALWVDLETGAWRRPGDRGAAPLPLGPQARTASSPVLGAAAGKWRTSGCPLLRAAAMGMTLDQQRLLFAPLAEEGREAVFSMGDDAPPAAVASERRLPWDYCKQRFAQVTNPAIDSLRESDGMSLAAYWGAGEIASPLLDERQWDELAGAAAAVDMTFAAEAGDDAASLFARLQAEVAERLAAGAPGIALSDAAIGPERCALPAMLAAAAAWNAMSERGAWAKPLWVATGQAWDTHHIAMLLAVGATGIHPYLAGELAERAAPGAGRENWRRGVEAGLKKTLARLGISALASYRGGQLFETLGLDREVTGRFFSGAASYLAGTSLEGLLQAARARHRAAYAAAAAGAPPALRDAGLYRFRHGGEAHGTPPEVVRRFHAFVRAPSEARYGDYRAALGERRPTAVRDLLVLRRPEGPARMPVPRRLESRQHGGPAARESWQAIARRFSTQAMSLGALGAEAQRTLALAMNRLGARSNTGEGGEDAATDRAARHRVKQVASARFGVTAEYLAAADELEIKIAQGSKPGEGGQLPPAKVTAEIARLRHAVPGMALISPPPHHDIYSIEDLAQLIHDLHAAAPRARIGVKLVSGAGVGLIAAGVAKAGAEVITIAGGDGGTGASPLTSIKNTGLPWELGLRETHGTLAALGLRERVRLRADGGFKSGRDVVIAALLGADEFGFATAALLALGCVMARQCHLNTCPAGIATQDPRLRTKFAGTPEMLLAYFTAVARETRALLDELGMASLEEARGREELLAPRDAAAAKVVGEWLAEGQPAAKRLPHRPGGRQHERGAGGRRQVTIADRSLGAGARPAVVGWRTRRFRGSAGQSFGAFLPAGWRYRLVGEANDGVGKGLSGGEIAITAGTAASRRGDVLLGNAALYGATAGRLFVAGRAGERFAVRNSGALAVVEGVGRHGCEYMTAGVVVVLGPCGGNFGAGMTGGLAYVPRAYAAALRPHRDYVRLAAIACEEESEALRRALALHYQWTASPRAAAAWPLVRVEPLALPAPVAATWAASLPAEAAPEEARRDAEGAEWEAAGAAV